MTDQMKSKISSLTNENKQLKKQNSLIQAHQGDASNDILKQFREHNEQLISKINSIEKDFEEKLSNISALEQENQVLKALTVKLQNELQNSSQTSGDGKGSSQTVNINNVDTPDNFHITITQANQHPIEFSYNTKTDEIMRNPLNTSEYQIDSIISPGVAIKKNESKDDSKDGEEKDDFSKRNRERKTGKIEDYNNLLAELKNHNDLLEKQLNGLKEQANKSLSPTTIKTVYYYYKLFIYRIKKQLKIYNLDQPLMKTLLQHFKMK